MSVNNWIIVLPGKKIPSDYCCDFELFTFLNKANAIQAQQWLLKFFNVIEMMLD